MRAHAMAPQIALVTGGNKGIGKEIVRKLAAMPGMSTVVLGCRSEQLGEAAAAVGTSIYYVLVLYCLPLHRHAV